MAPAEAHEPETQAPERLGHLLWETSSRVTLLAESAMSDTQLRPQSIGALERISGHPGITVSELAREATKSQQAISQLSGRLERLGYVERRLGPGRGVGLHVTLAGEAALAEGNAREVDFERELEQRLGAARYGQLRSLLGEARALLTAPTDERRVRSAARRRRG